MAVKNILDNENIENLELPEDFEFNMLEEELRNRKKANGISLIQAPRLFN